MPVFDGRVDHLSGGEGGLIMTTHLGSQALDEVREDVAELRVH